MADRHSQVDQALEDLAVGETPLALRSTELESAQKLNEPIVPDREPVERDQLEARLRIRDSEHARELAAYQQKALNWEREFKSALLDRELATSLAGRALVPGAAGQLIRLWAREFDVCEIDGQFRVMSKAGKPVAQAVAELLAAPEYSHFCQPTSRGGSATGVVSRTTHSASSRAPATLGEAVILQWREIAAGRSEAGPPPIGLGRRR